MLLIPTSNKKQLIILGILGIFFLGLAIYSNVLHAPFVYDDCRSIIENESIRNLTESIRNISSNRYLPLLSFALNYTVGGLKPFGYHLINNLIHVINAFLVYCLIILTFKTPFFKSQHNNIDSPRFFIAFSSAFVFIAHPIQTQAVTYVVQRSTLMATMFYLLSLVMYIKARLLNQNTEHRIKDPEKRQKIFKIKFVLCYLTSVICAVLAMKSKEIAFTLPLMVVLYEFCFFSETRDTQAKACGYISRITHYALRFLYLLPILLTMLIIPLSMLNIGQAENIAQDIDIQSRETINISRTDYLLTQFRVGITYLRLLICPVNQNADYDYSVYHSFFNPEVFLSFFCLLSMFIIAVYLLYKSRITHQALRLVAFGIFWFFITLSVESSIIPIRDVIVEHRLYLPSIGFFIASISLTDYLLPHTRVKIALIIVIVVSLSIGTYTRNIIWEDPKTLWEDVIAKGPNNSRAYNNLGVVYKERGEFDRAIEQFEKSLRANRNYTAVYFNLGDVQYRLGNYENAVAYLNQALTGKLNPQLHLDILNKLGRTYSAMGQTERAIEIFEKAVKLFPSSIVLLNNLGVQYIKNGQTDSAIELYEKAIKIEAKSYLYSNLASAYAKKGDEEKSRLMQQKALELGNN